MACLITQRVVFATDFKTLIIILWYVYICTGEGNGSPLLYPCLGNPVDRGAWWAAVHGVAQSRTRLKCLSSSSSMHTYTHKHTHIHIHVCTHSLHLCLILCNPMDWARQAPLSMAFPRWEYWSGVPILPWGDLLYQGSNPRLLHCRQILYHLSHQGSSIHISMIS